jgi:clan AA aspartic protease (TIGR02281 family)
MGDIVVELAGGKKAKGWLNNLDSVKVGDIEIKKVPAVIINSKEKSMPLLGMSFLKELEMSQSNNILTLKYNPP